MNRAAGDTSVTSPVIPLLGGGLTARGVLLVAGSARLGGGAETARIIDLPDGTTTLGRQEGGADHIALPDPEVSRRHAQIEGAVDGGYMLLDLGSRNGTTVDAEPASVPRYLRDGSVICLGPYVLVFRTLTDTEVEALRADAAAPLGDIPTLSPALALARARLRKLAATGHEVLLVGPPGAGKAAHAQATHLAAGRPGPFVAVDGDEPALERQLLQAGPDGDTPGPRLEEARGGTLFVAHFDQIAADVQRRLLRVLERDGRGVRLIASRTVRAPGEIFPSPEELMSGAWWLGADPIDIPPLRGRLEDLGALVVALLGQPAPFQCAAFHSLFHHEWPANVRELRKYVTYARELAAGAAIGLEHLPKILTPRPSGLRPAAPSSPAPPPAPEGPRPRTRVRPGREELEALLDRCHGNVSEMARVLQRQAPVVWRWIAKESLDPEKYRHRRR
jgi:transcriptional regulator with AAA-type ATPase domain